MVPEYLMLSCTRWQSSSPMHFQYLLLTRRVTDRTHRPCQTDGLNGAEGGVQRTVTVTSSVRYGVHINMPVRLRLPTCRLLSWIRWASLHRSLLTVICFALTRSYHPVTVLQPIDGLNTDRESEESLVNLSTTKKLRTRLSLLFFI